MLITIINHTPAWVFVLFFALVYIGYRQTQARMVSKNTLLIMPTIMIALSISGELTTFNLQLSALFTWCIGGGLAWLLVNQLVSVRGSYVASKQLFNLSGSWLPLILMMAIFFTKYVVGVLLAKQAVVINTTEFMLIVSLLYGSFSGAFAARAHKTWQLKATTVKPH
jgi:uncharacterized protein DUF6622